MPDLKACVVDGGMPDVVPHHCLADVGRQLLGWEFGRVDADDDQFFRELFAEPAQLRDVVVVVDSTVGPEL